MGHKTALKGAEALEDAEKVLTDAGKAVLAESKTVLFDFTCYYMLICNSLYHIYKVPERLYPHWACI